MSSKSESIRFFYGWYLATNKTFFNIVTFLVISGEYVGKKYNPEELITAWEEHEQGLNDKEIVHLELDYQEKAQEELEVIAAERTIVGRPLYFVRNFILGLIFNLVTVFYTLILKGN